MTTTILLFLLRLLSGILLLALLAALFVVIWRDYRSALTQIEASRRVYGQLIGLRQIDGNLALTGENYPLLPMTTIGRSPTNSITIKDSFASAEHALVIMRNGQWWLEDRQSRNGTMLNGAPINQPVVITHGDVIGIGNLSFRVELKA